MGQRGRPTDLSEQSTCEICGLTARNKEELEDHINHAHKSIDSKNASSEQKVDPLPPNSRILD
jgi:hypothetical protein